MNAPSELWFAACGALMTILGSTVTVVGWVASPPRIVVEAIARHVTDMDRTLRFVRMTLTGTQVLVAQCGASVLVMLVAVWIDVWSVGLVLVALIASAPAVLLSRARAERITRIEEQLDTWLLILANALKAIPALGEAMTSSVPLIGGPLSDELTVTLHEHALGSPLNVAIRTMATRVGSPVLEVAATTLEVARRTGGALSDTLEQAAASLREMARLEGVVRTKTAESKSQLWVVAFVPAVLLIVFHNLCPEVTEALFRSSRGHLVLLVAALMWVGAIASAVKILRVDI